MLGHRVWRIVGDAHDPDAERRSGFQVDVVETGAAQRDEAGAALLQPGQDFGIGRIVYENADRVVTGGEMDCVEVERRLVVLERVPLDGIGGIEKLAVVALGAEYGDLHGMSPV